MKKYTKRCKDCGVTFWMITEDMMSQKLIPEKNEFLAFKHRCDTGHETEILTKD